MRKVYLDPSKPKKILNKQFDRVTAYTVYTENEHGRLSYVSQKSFDIVLNTLRGLIDGTLTRDDAAKILEDYT